MRQEARFGSMVWFIACIPLQVPSEPFQKREYYSRAHKEMRHPAAPHFMLNAQHCGDQTWSLGLPSVLLGLACGFGSSASCCCFSVSSRKVRWFPHNFLSCCRGFGQPCGFQDRGQGRSRYAPKISSDYATELWPRFDREFEPTFEAKPPEWVSAWRPWNYLLVLGRCGLRASAGRLARYRTITASVPVRSLRWRKVMADVERDKISEGQIEEAEQDAEDPSDEKNPAEREDDQSDNTDVNK